MPKDVQILRGFSNLTNLDNVKPGMNIEEIEKQLINGGLVEKTKDPQDKFSDELQELADQLGINFGDIARAETPTMSPGVAAAISAQSLPSGNGSTGNNAYMQSLPSGNGSTGNSAYMQPGGSGSSAGNSNYRPATTDDDDYENSADKTEYGSDSWSNVSQESFSRSELGSVTQEQERRTHINSIMRDISPNSGFSFEDEKREDLKCAMLEEIDSLIYSLQDAEVDLSRIPKVSIEAEYDDIEKVLKILRHKSDRSRYCSLAEEFLIWGAHGMEELFDGKRIWLGKYQPCLTGWHVQVQTKLRRMRHDTSQLVSEVMHDYNIGPGPRVLLELIPNMFVYSSQKKKNMITGNMYSDADMAAANERLRQLN